jgi:hypothetical protein
LKILKTRIGNFLFNFAAFAHHDGEFSPKVEGNGEENDESETAKISHSPPFRKDDTKFSGQGKPLSLRSRAF